MTTVAFELPDSLIEKLGASPLELAAQAKQAFVLELLRQVHISQGKAAELLGVTRYDIMDLMLKYQIPSGPLTEKDIDLEIATAHQLAEEWKQQHASDKR